MLAVNSGGRVYKHDEPAKVGELWIRTQTPIFLAAVTKVSGYHINVLPMCEGFDGEDIYAVDFYSVFQRYVDELNK